MQGCWWGQPCATFEQREPFHVVNSWPFTVDIKTRNLGKF